MSEALKVCTFHLADLFCGIEVDKVQEVIRPQEMTRVPLAHPAVRGLINLRGRIIPVLALRVQLGLGEPEPGQSQMHVIVGAGADAVSFLVDELGDVLEVPESSFETVPEPLQGPVRELVRGVCKFPDRLLLLLDVDRAATLTVAADV